MQKKGISLIVLVITIIVMIILAATIILSISNNNVVQRAEEAVDTSNLKQVQELAQVGWADAYISGIKTQTELETYVMDYLKSNGMTDAELNKYKVDVTETGVTVTVKATAIDGSNVTATTTTTTTITVETYKDLEIGDVVAYNGWVVDEYETSGLENPKTDPANTSQVQEESYGWVIGKQKFTVTQEEQEAIVWVYIGQDKNGNHLLTTKLPVKPGGDYFAIYGSGGYAHGPDELDNLCKKLYGPSQTVARNMKIEDVERVLEYTGGKGMYNSVEGVKTYITTETIPTISELASQVKYEGLSSWKYSPESGKTIGSYKCNYYEISKNKQAEEITKVSKRLDVIFMENESYILSTQVTYADFKSNDAIWYLQGVMVTSVQMFPLFRSSGLAISFGAPLRPVVSF